MCGNPSVRRGEISAEYRLSAEDYDKACDRGDLKGIDGAAVREICNTIGRIGVIDRNIMGSNGWYSGYAVAARAVAGADGGWPLTIRASSPIMPARWIMRATMPWGRTGG